MFRAANYRSISSHGDADSILTGVKDFFTIAAHYRFSFQVNKDHSFQVMKFSITTSSVVNPRSEECFENPCLLGTECNEDAGCYACVFQLIEKK